MLGTSSENGQISPDELKLSSGIRIARKVPTLLLWSWHEIQYFTSNVLPTVDILRGRCMRPGSHGLCQAELTESGSSGKMPSDEKEYYCFRIGDGFDGPAHLGFS